MDMYSNYPLPTDDNDKGWWKGLLIALAVCACLSMCSSSCSRKHYYDEDNLSVTESQYLSMVDSVECLKRQYESLVQKSDKKDSVYIKETDSVYVYSKNDTVFVNRYKYRYLYKEQKVDLSVLYRKIDSIREERNKELLYAHEVDSISNSRTTVVKQGGISFVNYVVGAVVLFLLACVIYYVIKK